MNLQRKLDFIEAYRSYIQLSGRKMQGLRFLFFLPLNQA